MQAQNFEESIAMYAGVGLVGGTALEIRAWAWQFKQASGLHLGPE